MKINQIINELQGAGSGPRAAMARSSEEVRADLEYATLKKFSPKFANDFKAKFQLLGKTSVDAAYQAAAEGNPQYGISGSDAKALGSADRNSADYRDRLFKFRSAMPDSMKINTKTFVEPDGSSGIPRRRGWNDETHGHLRKATKDYLDAIKVAGDDKVADVKTGYDIGTKIGQSFSKGVSYEPKLRAS